MQSQLSIAYLGLIISTTIICLVIFSYINIKTLNEKNKILSEQKLSDLSSSLSVQIQDVNKSSKLILADRDVQALMENTDRTVRAVIWNNVRKRLDLMVENDPLIESIYMFTLSGDLFAVDIEARTAVQIRGMSDAVWLDDVISLKGAASFYRNGGGIFSGDAYQNAITLIRIINDLETQKAIGILMLNIPIPQILSNLEEPDSAISIHTTVKNDSRSLFESEWSGPWMDPVQAQSTEIFVRIPPVREKIFDKSAFAGTAVIIILVNSLFVFLGSFIVNRRFTQPIHTLTVTMKGKGAEQLDPVTVEDRNDEIGLLQNGYNTLIKRIHQLIIKERKDQEEKQKAELCALQAQIKPHFLYNSLDAIALLAIRDGSQDSYQALKSLGRFFRTSLSGGKDKISVAEELATVKRYMEIQEIRNSGIFSVTYSIDEGVKNLYIIKILLQPLVENALYHGIKPLHEPGNIHIRCGRKNGCLLLEVEDNGKGIENPEKVLSRGYGLKNIKDRLRIAYGKKASLDIYSVPAEGTIARILILEEAVHE
jgi:two-component system, sensor histidine kinase YesM